MPKFDKYVNALFLAASVVVWFVSRHYVDYFIGAFQLGRRLGGSADLIREVLPIFLGLVVFIVLKKVRSWGDFTHDAVAELVKVSWPSNKEVRFGTIVVIVTVLVAGAALGVLDLVLNKAVKVTIGA